MAAAVMAVGVTGDVGAGKSTVARLMEAAGGRFDADAGNGAKVQKKQTVRQL